MFCIHCGAQIAEEDRFCQHCGAATQEDATERAPQEPTFPEEPISNAREPVTEATVRKAVADLLLSQPTLPKGVLLFHQARKALKYASLEAGEEPLAFFGVKAWLLEDGIGVLFTTKGVRYWALWPLALSSTVKALSKERFVAYENLQTLGVMAEAENWEEKGEYTFCANDAPLVTVSLAARAGTLLGQFCDALSPLPFRSLYKERETAKPEGETVETPEETVEGEAGSLGIEAALGDGGDAEKRIPGATLLIVLACIVCFVIQLVACGITLSDDKAFRAIVAGFGGNVPILGSIVTSFLHGGWIHLILNMICLLQLGIPTEKMIGTKRFVLVYLLTTLGGGLLSASSHPADTVSVGASGGIYGLAGFLAVYGWLRIRDLRAENTFSPLQLHAIKTWVKRVLCFLGANFVASAQFERGMRTLGAESAIDIPAHLGGALAGATLGLLIWNLLRRSSSKASPNATSTEN